MSQPNVKTNDCITAVTSELDALGIQSRIEPRGKHAYKRRVRNSTTLGGVA